MWISEWEKPVSSQEVHPTGEQLPEMVSEGRGMEGTGGSMKVAE